MRRFFTVFVAGMVLVTSAAATEPKVAFTLDNSPAGLRGKMRPIQDNAAAYGYDYLDEDGWYHLLSSSGEVKDGVDNGLEFTLDGIMTSKSLRVKRFPMDDYAGFSAEQLDAATADMLVPGSSAEADIGVPVVQRSLVKMAGSGTGKRAVTAAVWDVTADALEAKGMHAVFAVVLTRKGKLVMVCTTDGTPQMCHGILENSLFMEEAAY